MNYFLKNSSKIGSQSHLIISQQATANTPHFIVKSASNKYIYSEVKTKSFKQFRIILTNKTNSNMLYDTYGEEYLSFLQELNEVLSVNELVELDYM